MQHFRSGLIIHVANSLKMIFVETYFTRKIEINLKRNRGARLKLPHWT